MDQQHLTDISYRHFIESVKDYAIYILDINGIVISWNIGAERAKGYTSKEIIGKFYGVFYSLEEQQLKMPTKNLISAQEHSHFEGEGWRYRKNGERFWAHVVIDPIYAHNGALEGFAKVTKDITEQKAFLDQISYLARYDTLTDLPNRNEFFTFTQKMIDTLQQQKLVICMLGIDNLKEVIDNRGYKASDTLLSIVANKIKTALKEDELLVRFGSNQFIALKTYENDQVVTDFYTRIYACFENTFSFDYRELLINVTIGVSTYPSDATNLEDLVNNADFAMLRASQKVEERICRYDKEIDGKNKELKIIGHDILNSIKKNELFFVYQKKYSITNESVSGYEALLRWKHPQLGIISPDLFIPIAEDTGKIIPLGYWAIEKVCTEVLAHGINKKVSINLSPVQLKDPYFIYKVKEILEKTNYPISYLEFEITETAFISDRVKTFKILNELQEMGISISLDDFGTGYSSLKLLHDFNFDCIKLDRSFIINLEHSKKSIIFLQSIISLIKSIQIPLIAEGVENEAQLAILNENGCTEIQGYIFGKPALFEDQ